MATHTLKKQILYWFGLPFVFAIKLYQHIISPWLRPSCRFSPTCSQYGIESIQKFGVVKGLYLTIKRIMKCRPGGGSGYDPIP